MTLTDSELLVKYGFIKDSKKDLYTFDEEKGHYVRKDGDINGSHADEELEEEAHIHENEQYYKTGFPKPGRRYKLEYEDFDMSLEEMYFWSLDHIRQDMAFPRVDKVTDIFSASENSAMFGQSSQRKSIQEDRASNFLRTIGQMVKTLFQVVRELRIIDERLEIYESWKESKSADSTLKGLYIDFAENKGGQMQPGSVYHLANQVGYASLPDLFFNTQVYSQEEIDDVVDDLEYNEDVKNVLRRKLLQFVKWKKNTHEELKNRRSFQLRYLRQHYNTIKTYMSWVKPYLRHIKRLHMNQEQLDSADIVSSFETSAQEIETLAIKPMPNDQYNAVVLMTFRFKTRPVLQYQQERHQGPVMIGRGTMELRNYAWTDHQIEMYKSMRESEELEMLGLVDDQLENAMDLLGDDLERYLNEAKGNEPEEEGSGEMDAEEARNLRKKLTSKQSIFDPFISLGKGFKQIGSSFVPKLSSSSSDDSGPPAEKKGAALGNAEFAMWMVYNNYKKAHGLLSW